MPAATNFTASGVDFVIEADVDTPYDDESYLLLKTAVDLGDHSPGYGPPCARVAATYATSVTVASATAFTVAGTGTNYGLQVDTATASAATGLKVKSAAAAGGLALSVISSGTNENLTVDAKGSGTITVGGTSTGAIAFSRAVTASLGASVLSGLLVQSNGVGSSLSALASNINSLAVVQFGTNAGANTNSGQLQFARSTSVFSSIGHQTGGSVTIAGRANVNDDLLVQMGGATIATLWDASGNLYHGQGLKVDGVTTLTASTATPAGGSTSARLLFGTTAGFGIYYGSGAPTVSAGKGSLYLRSDGSSTSTRSYVNTDGGTTWTNHTTAA